MPADYAQRNVHRRRNRRSDPGLLQKARRQRNRTLCALSASIFKQRTYCEVPSRIQRGGGSIESYPMDDNDSGKRNRQVGNALGLAADEVELWVKAIEEDGSGMGYVVHFSKRTPAEVNQRSAS